MYVFGRGSCIHVPSPRWGRVTHIRNSNVFYQVPKWQKITSPLYYFIYSMIMWLFIIDASQWTFLVLMKCLKFCCAFWFDCSNCVRGLPEPTACQLVVPAPLKTMCQVLDVFLCIACGWWGDVCVLLPYYFM